MMKTDLNMAREILEAHLKAASSSHRFSDSIHIQQMADPLDMTQEAAQRDVAVQILDRGIGARPAGSFGDRPHYRWLLWAMPGLRGGDRPEALEGNTVGRAMHSLPGEGGWPGEPERPIRKLGGSGIRSPMLLLATGLPEIFAGRGAPA